MKLTQRAANGIWMVTFYASGRRIRVSTGTRDRAEAARLAPELVAQTLSASLPTEAVPTEAASKYTLAQALSHTWRTVWSGSKSQREVKYRVQKITRELGNLRLSQLDYPRLRRYAEELRSAGAKPATINRHMACISRALAEAAPLGWIKGVPKIPHFKEDNVRERYLSDEEEAKLLKAIDDRAAPAYPVWTYMQALVPLLLDTGLRLGEAEGLTEDNLVGKRLVLRHGATKSGKGRSVPLTLRAQGAARALLDHPMHGQWPRGSLSKRFSELTTAIGMPDVTAHVLRHTCASRLVQAGLDLYRVKAWLGHATISTTERYAHLRPDELDDAAVLLERGTQKRPSGMRHPKKPQSRRSKAQRR